MVNFHMVTNYKLLKKHSIDVFHLLSPPYKGTKKCKELVLRTYILHRSHVLNLSAKSMVYLELFWEKYSSKTPVISVL